MPPANRSVDSNGVDLVSGNYAFSFTEAAIGAGEGALALTRSGANSAGESNWQNMWLEQTITGSTRQVTVILGNRSILFVKTGSGAFIPQDGSGGTLAGGDGADFVYRDGAGGTITFGTPAEDQRGASPFCSHAAANQNGCRALALTMARPNGAQTHFSWDVPVRCANIVNPDGGVDCDYAWRLAGVTNSFGYAIDFDFASDSYSFTAPSPNYFQRTAASLSNVNVTGADALTVGYSYPSSGVIEVNVPGPTSAGLIWRFSASGSAFAIRRPGSSSDDASVALSGGIVTSVTRDGVATGYARSVSGSTATTTVTDAANEASVIVSDLSIGRVTSVTDPLSRQTSYQYDGSGRLTRVTAAEGNYVAYSYDGRGNVTERRAVAKSDSGLADIVASASYSSSCANPVACNLPVSTTDARGNTTDYSYDESHGGVLSMTAPAPVPDATRPQIRYSYSQVTAVSGEPVYRLTGISACRSGTAPGCVGTADESRAILTYDSVNIRPTGVETRAGNSGGLSAASAYAYTPYGDVASVDGPLDGSADTTTLRYDGARRRIGTISPDPDGAGALKRRAQRLTYRPDGQVSAVEIGNVDGISDSDWGSMSVAQAVQTEFDTSGRPIVQRLLSGSTTHALTQASHDALGRAECVAQRMNPSEFATSALPADACTLDTEGSYGPDRISRTTYDAAGQVTKVESGVGVTGAAAEEITTTYSANGRIETATDANGNGTTYVYDGFDRLSRTLMPDPDTAGTSSTTDYEELGYDAGSNVTSRRLRDATSVGFSYDDLNRLTAKNLPGSELDVAYAYDLLGRMTSAATSAQTLTFAFDALGRNTGQTGPHGTVGYGYDLAGRRILMTYADSGLEVGYTYLVTGEVTQIHENPSGGNVLLGSYAYDDLGRRTSLTRGNGAVTSYAYDDVSRLTELAQNLNGTSSDLTLDFTLSPASEIATNARSNDAFSFTGHANGSVTSTINGLNQVTAQGGTSVSHDARGNVSAIGSASYGYDSENRLTNAPSSVAFGHDPLGRLYYSTGNPQLTRFAYDGDALIAEYDYGMGLLRRYVNGPGIDEPLVWYEGTGTSSRRYFHADERGSVVAVSDGSGNLVGGVNRYDEYGVPQGTLAGRFGYTGQMWLPEVGLYHYRARTYNPALGGRFMQTDPIGYEGGMNRYAYVRNNPVNFTDPMGLEDEGGEGPITVCGQPSRLPWDSCYDPAFAVLLEELSVGDFYMSLLDDGDGLFRRPGGQESLYRAFEGATHGLICGVPPLAVTFSLNAFIGPGSGASFGLSFDLGTGQFRGITSSTLGAGRGGGFGVNLGFGNESGTTITTESTISGGDVSVTFSSSGGASGGVSVRFALT